MNVLLLSEKLDSFLVEEVEITTCNTFRIDGHTVKEFYSDSELDELEAAGKPVGDFSIWETLRPICFGLIKGKRTPVSFKVTFHADRKLIDEICARDDCDIQSNLVRSLALNIRYSGGKVSCVTAGALNTFIMDKSLDRAWDSYVKLLFCDMQLDFEEMV